MKVKRKNLLVSTDNHTAMASLSSNWVVEKHIDFEYKRYLLLGYLQAVSEQFNESKLYPALGDLIRHYRNAMAIRESKRLFDNSFPEQLKAADLKGLRLIYEKLVNDDQVMAEIEQIVSYSIPRFEKYIREGQKIYEFIDSHLSISPVGIVPLNIDEGYLFLKPSTSKETLVYEYHMTIFEGPEDRYRGIHTQYLCSFEASPATTFENIKCELIRYRRELPNPAIYAIEVDLDLPIQETLLPVAKRTLVRHISGAPGSS